MTKLTVLVVDDPQFDFYVNLEKELLELFKGRTDIKIVGVDTYSDEPLMAAEFAEKNNFEFKAYEVDYGRYGHKAWEYRLREAAGVSDALVAFTNGENMDINNLAIMMKEYGKEVKLINY